MKRLALLSILVAVITCGLTHAQNPAVTVQGYHILGPADPAEFPRWISDMKRWRMEYLKRLGYDDAEYKRPELLWAQSSFMQPQMMVEDRYFYDPAAGKYTVDRYLADLDKRYGGIDSVLIWPVYALCYDIEKDASKAFDKAGLAAFERQIRTRFEAAATTKPAEGKAPEHESEYRRRRGERDSAHDLPHAEKPHGLHPPSRLKPGSPPKQTATPSPPGLVTRRKPDEALVWVKARGCARPGEPTWVSWPPPPRRASRELLTRLGRGNEALEDAWAAFRGEPCKYSFAELMKFVPKTGRAAWHEKAMDAAKGDDLQSLIELFIETKEMKRLAELVRGATDEVLEKVSHYATEPAAMKLEKALSRTSPPASGVPKECAL